MAELTPNERLQPALLDRLADDHPDRRTEPREERVMTLPELRESVIRDVGFLLNTVCLAATEELAPYPHVERSVLNYGIPDVTGISSSGIDVEVLTRQIREAIWNFEPRLLRDSVQVEVEIDKAQMSRRTLTFHIQADLWGQPLPQHLFLKMEMDLWSGDCTVAASEEASTQALDTW